MFSIILRISYPVAWLRRFDALGNKFVLEADVTVGSVRN